MALNVAEAVVFAGAGGHQRPLTIEPDRPAGEQHRVGGGDGAAAAPQQAVALTGLLLQRGDPGAEIHWEKRSGTKAAGVFMVTRIHGRGSALSVTAAIVQNFSSKRMERWRSSTPKSCGRRPDVLFQ